MNTKQVIAAAFTAVVVLFSNAASANEGGINSKKTSSVTEEQVNVKYQGTTENNIIFRVEFENPTSEKFSLIIKNDNGDVVYHQQFTDAHFSKSVFFQNTDAQIHPTFIIRTGNNNEIVRQFAVNRTLTESTVVTRL
ncbi:MAG: hypothetical protein JST42_18485 [Bacteroidetes bacterium]|nr:hypothetical protein [Bacteroidota bacterium]